MSVMEIFDKKILEMFVGLIGAVRSVDKKINKLLRFLVVENTSKICRICRFRLQGKINI